MSASSGRKVPAHTWICSQLLKAARKARVIMVMHHRIIDDRVTIASLGIALEHQRTFGKHLLDQLRSVFVPANAETSVQETLESVGVILFPNDWSSRWVEEQISVIFPRGENRSIDPVVEGYIPIEVMGDLGATLILCSQSKSLAAAARALGISKTAIRKRLRRLTDLLGFDPTSGSGRFQLTTRGRVVLDQVLGPYETLHRAWQNALHDAARES